MATSVRVPATGNAGEDAVLANWNVAPGAIVNQGDVLATIETAKASVEIEAPADGEVLELMCQPGDEVSEHSVIAILGEHGESVSHGVLPKGPEFAPVAKPVETGEEQVGLTPILGTDRGAGPRLKASPRARILAERRGVELAGLVGSGPGGRIIVSNVLAANSSVPRPLPVTSPIPRVDGQEPEFELVPVRGARKVTAQRMHASLQDAAQVTLTRYAEADALLTYARRLKAVTEAAGRPPISVNDLLLFATAKAVAQNPRANAIFDWDGIRRFTHVALGFAVDTEAALLVPVLPRADQLSLAELSQNARELIERARSGKLTSAQMEGGTFTVSNLGGLGVHWFTPVLNPPQVCILGVGAAHQSHPERPTLLPLSLTFDHRALDGAAAASVLADIAASIETVDVLAAF